jgi:ribosomal-protein-serine acetyltransferase
MMVRLVVGDEIAIRLHEQSNVEELYALIERNRSYLKEWMPWADQGSEESSEFVKRALQDFATGEACEAGIWYQERLVGSIGLHARNSMFRKMEMGYWISEESQGKGIVTRSCLTMMGFAFDELKLNRVEIQVAVGNDRSSAIPERLGFTREGTLRKMGWHAGEHVDLVVYGMLAEEWKNLI